MHPDLRWIVDANWLSTSSLQAKEYILISWMGAMHVLTEANEPTVAAFRMCSVLLQRAYRDALDAMLARADDLKSFHSTKLTSDLSNLLFQEVLLPKVFFQVRFHRSTDRRLEVGVAVLNWAYTRVSNAEAIASVRHVVTKAVRRNALLLEPCYACFNVHS